MLGVPSAYARADMSEHSGFVYLAQKVGDTVANKVTALDLAGINVLPDTERVDPAGSLAAPLVGAVGSENTGQAGLEYQYNSLLAGQSGIAEDGDVARRGPVAGQDDTELAPPCRAPVSSSPSTSPCST